MSISPVDHPGKARMSGSRAAVLVFVRAPEAGLVKTRLAAEIGPEAALRVYKMLAEQAVAAASGAGIDTAVRVHFTPADAERAVREWLGDGPVYLPQAPGDLGDRLRNAFREAFRAGHERVVVIGSDLPAMHAELLRHAFRMLDEHTAVLGPARDGGYYLLGLREPCPQLFTGIPWSTERVLEHTLERLRSAGAAPVLLETLTDVDHADDLPAGWLEDLSADNPRYRQG